MCNLQSNYAHSIVGYVLKLQINGAVLYISAFTSCINFAIESISLLSNPP